MTIGLLMSAGSTGLSLLQGGPDIPEYGFSAEDVDRLIEAYRQSGMAGLRQLGISEKQGAGRRLAASGQEPTLAMQSAMFTPITERLGGARAGLEGQLAGVEGGLLQHIADMQFQGDMTGEMAQWGNLQNMFAGLADVGGTIAAGSQIPPWLKALGQSGGQGLYNPNSPQSLNPWIGYGGVNTRNTRTGFM